MYFKYPNFVVLKQFKQFILPIFLVILSASLWGITAFARGFEYIEESEKDIAVRTPAKLQITQLLGNLSVQGWSNDRIRIKIKKTVVADSPEEAKNLFKLAGYRSEIADRKMEINSQYDHETSAPSHPNGDGSNNLNKSEKLNKLNSNEKRVRLDMVVMAPFYLQGMFWGVSGSIEVRNWNADLDVRSNSGAVLLDSVKAKRLSVTCSSCAVRLKGIQSSLRVVNDSGSIDAFGVSGKPLYFETNSGPVQVTEGKGNQIFVSRSGSILGQLLSGKIEFHSTQGQVVFREVSGFISGSGGSGNISIGMRKWEFLEKAFIDSEEGNVSLTLPESFSGEFDLKSGTGQVSTDFQIRFSENGTPRQPARILGDVREGGETLKITSRSGNIEILRRK